MLEQRFPTVGDDIDRQLLAKLIAQYNRTTSKEKKKDIFAKITAIETKWL